MRPAGKLILGRASAVAWACLVAALVAAGLSGCATGGKGGGAPAKAGPVSQPQRKAAETFDAVWQMIYDTHFDTNFHGVNWVGIRETYRKKALATRTPEELREALQGMLDLLGQSHMAILPMSVADSVQPDTAGEVAGESPSGGRAGEPTAKGPRKGRLARGGGGEGRLGMEVRLEGNRILVTHLEIGGAAAAAGVKSGWILEAIDGERLAETLKGLRKGVSEQKAKVLAWSAVEHALRGAPDSVARLAFLDERDRPVTLSLRRKPETGEPVSLGNLPKLFAHSEFETLRSPGGLAVGYLHFNMWMLPAAMAVNQAMEEFRGAGGIVVDMRGNIGGIGMMVMGVAGHFVDEPVSLGTMKMRGNELHILANPRRVGLRGERVEPYAGPVAILVDDISLSAAEIFAGGMQAIGRARIFGETSAGQALPSSLNRLPNGDILYHAIADFVTPNGTRLEGRGVIPDERVPLRRKDLLEGRDGALRAALQWIENETKSGRKAK